MKCATIAFILGIGLAATTCNAERPVVFVSPENANENELRFTVRVEDEVNHPDHSYMRVSVTVTYGRQLLARDLDPVILTIMDGKTFVAKVSPFVSKKSNSKEVNEVTLWFGLCRKYLDSGLYVGFKNTGYLINIGDFVK